MCKTNASTATPEQLTQLRDPAAVAALEVLKKNGWLALDAPALDKFFEADVSHPAKVALEEEARMGGAFAVYQFAVFLGLLALSISVSAFLPVLPPMVFVLWGVLGVGAGLLARKYPGRVFGNRKPRA